MTAQMSDRLEWEHGSGYLLGELPLPADERVVPCLEDDSYEHTACWRGYLARWSLRDGQLWLDALEGGYRLGAAGPVPADWVTAVIRVAGGGDVVTPVHLPYATLWRNVHELDLRAGRLHAQWLLTVPASGFSAAWEDAPESRALFARKILEESRAARRAARALLPSVRLLTACRTACREARLRAELGPCGLCERAGLSLWSWGQYLEWEDGEDGLTADEVVAVFRALELPTTLLEALASAAAEELRAAQEAEAHRRATATLAFIGRAERYLAPPDVGRDEVAVLAWARACVAASRWPAQVWFTSERCCWLARDGAVKASQAEADPPRVRRRDKT